MMNVVLMKLVLMTLRYLCVRVNNRLLLRWFMLPTYKLMSNWLALFGVGRRILRVVNRSLTVLLPAMTPLRLVFMRLVTS